MPYKYNPFSRNLTYYEPGPPEDGEVGQVLTVDPTGDSWEWSKPTEIIGNAIVSNPATDCLNVTNIYVDAVTRKTVVEFSDVMGGTTGGIISAPPLGQFRVTNIYVNQLGKTVVDYDDTPQS